MNTPERRRPGRGCSICRHREARSIDSRLAAGEPLRAVAERFGVSLGALSRHRLNHVPPQPPKPAPTPAPAPAPAGAAAPAAPDAPSSPAPIDPLTAARAALGRDRHALERQCRAADAAYRAARAAAEGTLAWRAFDAQMVSFKARARGQPPERLLLLWQECARHFEQQAARPKGELSSLGAVFEQQRIEQNAAAAARPFDTGAFLRGLAARGIALSANATGQIEARPARALTAADREVIAANRAVLVDTLATAEIV
jgi:hypothetical protein